MAGFDRLIYDARTNICRFPEIDRVEERLGLFGILAGVERLDFQESDRGRRSVCV